MEKSLVRCYFAELIGSFVLVYFAAAVVCVNHITALHGEGPGLQALGGTQPGVVGIALAQGLILAVLLAATVPVSGGYLNPAITIMLWVFNRLDTLRTSWYVGAQLLGGVLAGLCVRFTFSADVLRSARWGAPFVNDLVFPVGDYSAQLAGTGVELLLTFSLVLAIFSIIPEGNWSRLASVSAGAALAAGVLVGFPLTGAALNPARWFGPALWEVAEGGSVRGRPITAPLVYVAGPVLGALAGGLISFKFLVPAAASVMEPAGSDGGVRAGVPPAKTRK